MEWQPIEWDDGYPTDESLEYYENVRSFGFEGSGEFLVDTLKTCVGNCCAFYRERNGKDTFGKSVLLIDFSTGGWSGAEDIISIIQRNIFLSRYMLSWRRGGHYVFEIPVAP